MPLNLENRVLQPTVAKLQHTTKNRQKCTSDVSFTHIFLPYTLKIGFYHIYFAYKEILRKLVHAINRDFLVLKIENFQLKNTFLIFAQNIDCGYTLKFA